MHRSCRALLPTALAFLLIAPAGVGIAGSTPATGRYRGTTGDGHVIEFTVARSAKPGFARKITHFHVVYDIAGCRSGPVRQAFFASVRTGGSASSRGSFSRTVGHTGKANEVQLRLTGRFTTATRASGGFRVGVAGRCPLNPTAPALRFSVRRR
ncbi:MAG: hypothetical protein QOH72_1559 [Solirubrobacteraceae bacterium]|jgi:hypothetical protein|nr:hypothetical protein [Solirubrobacteraceae bacterium]